MQNHTFDTTDLTWLARLAHALLHESHAADDLVQETMVAALEGPMPASAPPRAWLGSVARRLAARRYRGEARRTRREEHVARPEALPDSAELVERAEVAEHVTAATRALPEPFRRTVLLHFLEGRTPDEIARQVGKPTDTVRWRLRRGLVLLREELVQRDGRDWSSWCLVLAPLAASIASPAPAAVTSASALSSGMSTSFLASVATAKVKWLLAAALVVLAGSGLWFVWKPDPMEPDRLASSTSEPANELEPTSASSAGHADTPNEELAVVATTAPDESSNDPRPADEAPSPIINATPGAIFGRVADATERPVAGATIYLVPSVNGDTQDGNTGDPEVLAQTKTDDQGKFVLPPDSWESAERGDLPSPDLGVVANGFLREVVVDPLRRQGANGLLVVLESGRTLSGRVVDESGYPVAGLNVLAHTADAGVDHVSPSQSRMRADRSELGDARSRYHHCHGRTDDNGEVVFTGLPDGDLVVRSLDPAWKIDEPRLVRADGSYVTWYAKHQLGVRLFVVDAATGLPVDRASARFALKVIFADGGTDNLSQWVGRGNGTISFAFTPDLVALGDRVITEATFYGTVKYGDVRTEWEAEPIEDPWGASGIADVRVEVDTAAPPPTVEAAQLAEAATGEAPNEPPSTELELQVGYTDGSTYDGRLVVAWTSRNEDSEVAREGKVRTESWAPGQYRMTIPAGDVSLRVYDFHASGSLPPWTGEVRCEPNSLTTKVVTLQRGGTVTIERPDGWTGNWQLHASWRLNEFDPWSGSWNYGTPEETLTLSALKPAEWRFQLRRGTERDTEPIIRTIFVSEGDDLVVER